MGGGGKGSSAAPPQFGQGPFFQAAQAQGDQSKVGLQGVVGGSGWTQDPTTGRWTQTQQFTGPLSGAAQGYQNQIANQGPIDFSGLPQLNQGTAAQQQATNAAYSQARSRLDPMFAQQGEQLQAQLAAQGLDPGTQAADAATGNFNRARNDAYSSAQNYAVGQGLQAQQQAFGQSFGARQQALQELLKQRGMPLEQLQGIMGLLGGAQGVGAAGAPNYLGATEGQAGFNLQNQNMLNQAAGQGWSNLLGAAGQGGEMGLQIAALGMLSDERAKQRIERLPVEVISGVPFAVFEWRSAPGRKLLGLIAQDLKSVAPGCLFERNDGLLCVDLVKLRERIHGAA